MEISKISVVVPVFNVEKYLEKCVRSIVGQTYKNLEIILVDDGSTDNSCKICDELKKEDPRIMVIHKENGGLSDARNVGIQIATGEYYSFVDSDDYLEKNALETLMKAIKTSGSEIAICNMMRFYDDGSTEKFYLPTNEEVILDGIERFNTLNQPSVCNKMFLASLFDGIRFPYGKFYEDTYVYHELLYKANRVVMTGKTGYWYLSRKGSILGRPKFNHRYFDFIEAVFQRTQFLVEKNVQPYGYEAFLSLYAAVANAEKYINYKENEEAFINVRKYYKQMYNNIAYKKAGFNIKQIIRIVLLRYFPKIHSKLY